MYSNLNNSVFFLCIVNSISCLLRVFMFFCRILMILYCCLIALVFVAVVYYGGMASAVFTLYSLFIKISFDILRHNYSNARITYMNYYTTLSYNR